MTTIKINIPEIIGTGVCVATADGQKVHDVIATNLRAGNVIEVSFLGVKSIITAFLNAAIGQLYGEFKEDELSTRLLLKDAQQDDVEKVNRVITGAIIYFKDKKKFEAAQREGMGLGND